VGTLVKLNFLCKTKFFVIVGGINSLNSSNFD